MSCSIPLAVASSHHHQPSALSAVDGRDTVHYSPTLSASPASIATSTSHLSAPHSFSDTQSPLFLASPTPAIPEAQPVPSSSLPVAHPNERVRSLIHGYSTSLIASAVREKAWSDLQRLEEIFASPSEQAHLTKQQKWKLALRQQRLKLYLQHEQLDHALQQPHETHPQADEQEEEEEEEEEQLPKSAEEEKVEERADPSHFLAPPPHSSLTIFTTPPLPPSQSSISLARELSSFSLYTPEGLSSTTATFSFSIPLRSPSAPAEAAYSIPSYDTANSLQLTSTDSPSTPSSSTSSASRSPSRPPRALPPDSAAVATLQEEATVSRSGRPIKRKFELATLGGVRRGKKPSVGSEAEALGLRRSSRAVVVVDKTGGEGAEREEGSAVRAWERESRDSDEDGEEEEDDEEADGQEAEGRQAEVGSYGVAYRH